MQADSAAEGDVAGLLLDLIVRRLERLLGCTPFHGARSVWRVGEAPDGVPRALTTDLLTVRKNEYVVLIPALEMTCSRPNQLVYQLAHEAFHHYFDPLIESHALVEVLAVATSLSILSSVADEAACIVGRGYSAQRFIEYRIRVEREAALKCGTTAVPVHALPPNLLARGSAELREAFVTPAVVLAGATVAACLDREPRYWRALPLAHDCVSCTAAGDPIVNLARWRASCVAAEVAPAVVDAIDLSLGGRFDLSAESSSGSFVSSPTNPTLSSWCSECVTQ